ncbi:MAG: helix-turn-helix domain-containing protein [Lachnospiraceae bacterium]|nr:helix-turn-helix domain-containing protein [Lachnospiraceae bacterium]
MLDGSKLKFLRYTHNKTQAEVAAFCDVSIRAIKMFESNERKPSEEVYAAYLNCIYDVGKPLGNRPNKRGKKKESAEQSEQPEE